MKTARRVGGPLVLSMFVIFLLVSQGAVEGQEDGCSRKGKDYAVQTGSSGTIRSPGWPNAYHGRSLCRWKITVPDGQRIRLVFKSFDVERGASCQYDYLQVQGGTGKGSMSMFCGIGPPGALITTGNTALVDFRSDDDVGGKGFELEWSVETGTPGDDVSTGKDMEECSTHPCKHGRCVSKHGGYKCTCFPGWTGRNCQHDINECLNSPCQHGHCVNKDGGYECTCSTGWTGQNCQEDINECLDSPCQYGHCVNGDGGCECTCSTGWTGQHCQEDINECARNQCQHGRCVNNPGGYKCTCSAGWTGPNCQQRAPPKCRSGWSKYNNHCYKLMGDKVSWTKADSQCKQSGANLASITDNSENNFIKHLIANAPAGQGIFRMPVVWSGLQKAEDGHWKWTDGSRVSYTNWAKGEPDNNLMTSLFKGENCVGVYSKAVRHWPRPESSGGQWTDIFCDQKQPYICKSPADY